MADVCIVFVLHHPERLRHITSLDAAGDPGKAIDEQATRQSLRESASQSFLPALKLLREALEHAGGAARIAICPTGPLLRSAEKHHAALLGSLQKLNASGAVEWVCAPRDHSILSIYPGAHLTRELQAQADHIQRLFGTRPTTAANTELIYDNSFARRAAAAGMKLVLAGHADRQLAGRSASRVYRAAGDAHIKLLARHAGLSDDWGIRFSDASWSCYPLKPETYATWIADGLATSGGAVCPIMLYLGDIGITHSKQSGIFSFTRRLLGLLLRRGLHLVSPHQAAERAGALAHLDVLDVPQATSGWGPAFDLSPWLGNAMQSNALHLLRKAIGLSSADDVARKERASLSETLLRLSAIDHLRAMRHAPASGASGWGVFEERRRPKPYESAYDAYLDYTNALRAARHPEAG